MLETTIYSIGHGNKKIHDFLAELEAFNIQYLLDIRSKPYSKWNPHFNREALEEKMTTHGLTYVFVGESLGGLPKDTACYDHNGKVVYDIIKNKEFFLEGMRRVITANEKRINVALMCSESKPEECHRSKLIGQELIKKGISIRHIVPGRKIKSQQTVMNELTKGRNTTDLFGNEMDFTSRKSY